MRKTDELLKTGLRRRTAVHMEGDDAILQVETSDPGAAGALATNQKLRQEGVVGKRPDMHWTLSLPEFEYYMLIKKYPDLNSPDHEIKTRAWKTYLRSAESKPYRVMG